jgi:hypothetical protein
MNSLFMLCLLLPGQEPPKPELYFKPCPTTDKHISIQHLSDNTSVVHCHVRFTEMASKRAFVRLRTVTTPESERSVSHAELKEVSIESRDETWRFFLKAARFPNATDAIYQLEIGELDYSNVDEYQVKNTFAWKYKDGAIVTGTKEKPMYLAVQHRRIVQENGEFKLRMVYETGVSLTDVRYGLVSSLTLPKDGTETAIKD